VLLRQLLPDDPPIRLENNKVIWSALNDFLEFEKTDFQDALIARKAKALGCSRVLSFDKVALTLPNFWAP